MHRRGEGDESYIIVREKSNLFSASRKFGSGHIPEDQLSSAIGPGAYEDDLSSLERRMAMLACKALEIKRTPTHDFLISTIKKKQAELAKLEPPQKNFGLDLNELTKRMGCKRQLPLKKCNLSRASRFPKMAAQDDIPGPGTYGNPNDKSKKKYFRRCYQDFNIRRNVNRSLNPKQSDLAPGMYNIRDVCQLGKILTSSWGEKSAKSVWTDTRNYLQSPTKYNIKSGMDELLSKNNYHGKFGKAARFPNKYGERIVVDNLSHAPRDPDEPGPAHFERPHPVMCKRAPHAPKIGLCQSSLKSGRPAFNSTSKRVFSFLEDSADKAHQPGPGRYTVEVESTCEVPSCQSAFRSKTRAPTDEQFMTLRERLRASHLKNIPLCDIPLQHYCTL